MQYVYLLLFGCGVLAICYLADKGLTKLFRNRRQHKSGLAVRHNKKVMAFGLILVAIGIAAVLAAGKASWLLYVGGGIILLVGVALMVLYATFGVYYDEDTFLVTSLRKKSATYSYRDIRTQALYNNAGSLLIELHMADGTAVQLQWGMDGMLPFMDKAFSAWLRQTGRSREECTFYDPNNFRWFPEREE